jgi:DNA helicase HerA-like ATPase
LTTLPSFTGRAAATASGLRQRLLNSAELVGGIYNMDFHRALVISNDIWKKRAGGLPQHCFLLATTLEAGAAGGDPDDEEIILLRVEGTAKLPRESELVEVREEAMRALLGSGTTSLPEDAGVIDVLTRNEIQFSAFDCRVLGTFYDDTEDGHAYVEWGADVDTLYSASRYKVYKPTGDALSFVASYPDITAADLRERRTPERIAIGNVRYSSTRRRAERAGADAVPVRVRVEDFISMKTAVFGMTRVGKSNTMKTIATAVFTHAQNSGRTIGQLLFDPAGEYAYANTQDMTALAAIGPQHVRIYRYGASEADVAGGLIRPLQINFYAEDQLATAQSVISQRLVESAGTADYVKNFLSAELMVEAGSQDRSKIARVSRARLLFYAMLAKAGFSCTPGFRFTANMKGDLVDEITNALTDSNGRAPARKLSGAIEIRGVDDLRRVVDWLLANQGASQAAADWLDDPNVAAVLAVYEDHPTRSGWRKLRPLLGFHNAAAVGDYAQNIYDDLLAGRIVIVDLSRGNEAILQSLSENTVNFLLQQAAERFAEGHEPHAMQIFIEEAHRLFDRDAMKNQTDPYVRLAKEAAKYKIGLVYATQEVTSVDDRILANTSNWVVAHLNNSKEIKKLTDFYDFGAYAETTLRAEDRGFARVKTLSGKYIVPVQIARFDNTMINQARTAAGLDPVDAHDAPAGGPVDPAEPVAGYLPGTEIDF